MRDSGFPAYKEHKAAHDELLRQVLELKRGFDKGDLTVTMETMNFLRDWLQTHIKISDQEIAKHLAADSGPVSMMAGAR